jgi:putative acetyltransferase
MNAPTVRRARPEDSDAVAALFRRSKETALPYLPDLHTPDEDRRFFRERVFPASVVWVVEEGGALAGFCALREGWIDHLYVDPAHQRAGIGTALLRKAMENNDELRLWTFQRNTNARAFYEAHGFTCVKTTDGAGNEEREPDSLYSWAARQQEKKRLPYI